MVSNYQPVETIDTDVQDRNTLNPTSSSTEDRSIWSHDQQPLLSETPSITPRNGQSFDMGEETYATASPVGCAINLSNTILGTGVLAMPAAVASVGLIPGILVVMLSAVASGLGLYFLTRCAVRTEGRHASFFAISKMTWPHLAVFFDLAIAIKCFGVAVSYLIIMGGLMPQVMASLVPDANGAGIWMDRRFWITVFMATLVLPLSFLRKLDSLKYTSVAALIAVVYLCVIVIYYYFSPNYQPPPPENIELIGFSSHFLRRLPVFVFAFTCHQNIFTVYNELQDNSQPQVNKVISMSIGSATIIYEAIAILGYLSFGKNVLGNIILEYPQSIFVAGGRLAIVILVIFSYPLQAHPCRASLDKVLAWRPSGARSPKMPPPPSAFKYYIMTTVILILSYVIAIMVTELDVVLAFVGSTGSTTISFILPGLFYYKLHENDPWHASKVTAVSLATYGLLVMVVCLTSNVLRFIH